MKSITIYYSFTGNTHNLAEKIAYKLKAKGEVDLICLKPLDESKSFLGQCIRAFREKKAKVEEIKVDLSDYDLICLGTPVWAFGPTPSMNTYLDICTGLNGKKVILFVTYGSGTGVNRCFNKMERELYKKGAKNIKHLAIQQDNIGNEELVNREIDKIL